MPPKTKRPAVVWTVTILSVLLIILGFSCPLIGGLLQDGGYGGPWLTVLSLGGLFVCLLLAIGLLFWVQRDAIIHDLAKQNGRYDALPLTVLSPISPENILAQLTIRRFRQTPEGYLRRKVFSWSKDSITYYAQIAPADDIPSAIASAYQQMNRLEASAQNICLLLFLCKDKLSDTDKTQLRQSAKTFIIAETTVPVQTFQTLLPILIERSTTRGYFLDAGRHGLISVYGHGARLLKNYFTCSNDR